MTYIMGLAIFNKDRYLDHTNKPTSIGLLLLLNKLEEAVFSVEPKDMKGVVSIKPYYLNTDYVPKFDNGKWKMEIKTTIKGDILLNTTTMPLTSPEQVAEVEREWKRQVTSLLQNTIDRIQKKWKTDCLQYALIYHRHFPKQWNAIQADWPTIFPTVQSDLQVEVVLMRSGESQVIREAQAN